MPTHRVYLGHVDVGQDAELDLMFRSDSAVLQYIFRYGLIADQVLMQGSAPLKSNQVFLAYDRLREAFKRDENHDESKPIFAFVLSDEAEDYTSYIRARLQKLRETDEQNAEKVAYLKNHAVATAEKLDVDLLGINIPKRNLSVSKAFRGGLLTLLKSNDYSKTKISEETSQRAIEMINQTELLQTFSLIASLNLREPDQVKELYNATRDRYREANARGIGAMNSDADVIWSPLHIDRFLDEIGLTPWLKNPKDLTSELLFKIRRLENFRALRDEYFKAQSRTDFEVFVALLYNLRSYGIVSSIFHHLPGWIAACLPKPAEIPTKEALTYAAEYLTGYRYDYHLNSLLKRFKHDMRALN